MNFTEWLNRLLGVRTAGMKRHLKKPNYKMPPNIYEGRMLHDYVRKFERIHTTFKYLYLYPLVGIATKILGKHMDKKIPKRWYNKNLIILDKAIDKSVYEWYSRYLMHVDKMPPAEVKARLESDRSVKLIKSLKYLMFTIVLNDTAYRELVNIMCHNIAHGMMKEYKGKTVNHLFYSEKSIYSTVYLNHGQQLINQDYTKVIKKEAKDNGKPKRKTKSK